MDLLTYSGRVRISKYKKADNIAKLNELTPYATSELSNKGTIYLWRTLCRFLTSSAAPEGGYERPRYLEMGYEAVEGNNTVIHSVLISSIQCSEANILNMESTDEENGAKAAFVFSLFSANKKSDSSSGNIYFYLCSDPAGLSVGGDRTINGSSVLAKVDTGSANYSIQSDEVHIFQWELQFKNKVKETGTQING